MILSDVRIRPAPDPAWSRVSALLESESPGRDPVELWVDVPSQLADQVDTTGTPWLIAALPMAYALGEPLRVRATVDADLLRNVYCLLDVWGAWNPNRDRIRIEVDNVSHPDPIPTARVGMFFSGGLDSFYTLLRHHHCAPETRENIEELLLLWGFDVPPDVDEPFHAITRSAEQVAREVGKTLTVIRTNLRLALPVEASWTHLAHGPVMAGAALVLGKRYKRLLIASSIAYRRLGQWGTHPATDPYYGTSLTAFLNDGAVDRFQKTPLVAASDLAMKHLRVCTRPPFEGNCGRCPKCLRTMISLELLGSLDRCATLPPLDLRKVRRMNLGEGFGNRMYRSMWANARRAGREDIAKALATAIRRTTMLWFARGVVHRLGLSTWKRIGPYLERIVGVDPELGPAWPTEAR